MSKEQILLELHLLEELVSALPQVPQVVRALVTVKEARKQISSHA